MDTFFFSYIILAPLSLISQIILIYGYIRVKKMREYPEILVFWQCIAQSILDVHWITGFTDLHRYLSGLPCQLIGAFCVYCYFINWDYILCLSLEVLIKLKNPFNSNYKTRLLIYHLSSHLSSFVIFIILSSVSNNSGKSLMNTCFVEEQSGYELVVFIPVFIHAPVCIFTCLYAVWASWGSKHGTYARYHIYVVTVFSISWLPLGIAHGLEYERFHVTQPEWFTIVYTM